MSEQRQVSETARSTAFMRALSCYEDDGNIKGHDHLAELFLPEERRAKLGSGAYREAAKQKIRAGTYEYLIARTAYFDRFFLDCLQTDTPQIVLLGAGYDTRAYRFGERAGGAKIFEADAPFTQDEKIETLNRNNIDHSRVRFVPVDFEKDSLSGALCAAGFDKAAKSAFIWEGVTLYLTEAAARGTLRHIAECSARGSLIGLDYLNFRPGAAANITRKDEAVLFGMGRAEMAEFMRGFGFAVTENLGSEEIADAFLKCEDGQILGNIKSTMNFLKAELCL